MKRLAILAVALAPTFANAQASQCKHIQSDDARLACYDAAFGNEIQTTHTVPAHWNVETRTSDFTDQTDVYISTLSQESLGCSIRNRAASLFVRCQEGTTSVFVSHGCYAPSDNSDRGTLRVEMRFDDGVVRARPVGVSSDDNAFGWWDIRGQNNALVKNLLKGSRLVMRFRPYRHAPETLKFNVSGLKAAMQSVQPSCDWDQHFEN